MVDVIRVPDQVQVLIDDRWKRMRKTGEGEFFAEMTDVTLTCKVEGDGLRLRMTAPKTPVERLHIRFAGDMPQSYRILCDAWERGYGELGWGCIRPEQVLPWYFMVNAQNATWGVGVKTQPGAMCYWHADPHGVTLTLDVRSGGDGVLLGNKALELCTVVSYRSAAGESAFAATRAFCQKMCEHPLSAGGPVYGGNNWYYAYGKSSQAEIKEDTLRVKALAPQEGAIPFMVIDACWQTGTVDTNPAAGCAGGPYLEGNADFPDMPGLAAWMRARGVRPGIWMRPSLVQQYLPERMVLPRNRFPGDNLGMVLDPTVPEALDWTRQDIARLSGWGYELIKHDFSTNDILGGWGFMYGPNVTRKGWHFHDRSVTTAQALINLYRAIREGAGEKTLILGCNAVGHLGAGLFNMQRTGDDTSGREWERTRKMGINTLAFRMAQHGTFFDVDADCVGLTDQVPWALNSQWLDLLARSGTPLFVSADPKAMGDAQNEAVKAAFARAAHEQPLGEPLDWFDTSCPEHWRFGQEEKRYDWYGDGLSVCMH